MTVVWRREGKITNRTHSQIHRRNEPVSEFVDDNNFALDRKVKEACTGIKTSYQWLLKELPRNKDKELIAYSAFY